MKRCCKCKNTLPYDCFGSDISSKDKLHHRCKKCNAEYYHANKTKSQALQKAYRSRNYVKIADKDRRNKRKYHDQWIAYFIKQHGLRPVCEICGQRLYWRHKSKLQVVNFDHRHGGNEPDISGSPASFIRARPCNIQNQVIWRRCDFGILCRLCNNYLPTHSRREWLYKALLYEEKTRKQEFEKG